MESGRREQIERAMSAITMIRDQLGSGSGFRLRVLLDMLLLELGLELLSLDGPVGMIAQNVV